MGGCMLFSQLERYHLDEQRRADDSVHMNLVKKLAAGLQITCRDLKAYKALEQMES